MPWLVAITAAGTIFQAFDAIDFWFQSRVLSKYSVLAKNTAFLVASLVKISLILGKAPLLFFAATGLFEIALGSCGLILAFLRHGRALTRWNPSISMARKLLADSWPLILSGISIMVYMRIGQIMLGNLAGNQAVGIYSAATKISELWYFIPTAIVSSVYPAIIQAKRVDQGLYYRRLQRLFSIMTLLSLSIALPMTFLSGTIVSLLFGREFLAAGPVLAVHIWAAFFVFLGVAQGPWDLTENLTKLSLFRSTVGAIVNVVLNSVLIPIYGPIGTAIAAVVSYMFSAYLLNVVTARTRRIFFCQTSSFLFYKHLRFIRE
jgi:PST family polysaccharide transporter